MLNIDEISKNYARYNGGKKIDAYGKGYIDGVVEFAKYLKDVSFCCDPDNWCSFQAIDTDDLDDFVDEFLQR